MQQLLTFQRALITVKLNKKKYICMYVQTKVDGAKNNKVYCSTCPKKEITIHRI